MNEFVDIVGRFNYNYSEIEKMLTDMRSQSAVSDMINGLSKDKIKGVAFFAANAKYRDRFQLTLPLYVEIIGSNETAQECIDLVEKSCQDGIDYVAERYGIDREHELKHYDVILD